MSAIIISAFPACGKTTYYNKWSRYSKVNVWRKHLNGEQAYTPNGHIIGEKILDSDSSNFSWIKDENGKNTKERNPEFPKNYIEYIKEKMQTEDIIFVSSHKEVRQALKENSMEYHIFYPSVNQKSEWIRRFKERGDSPQFIDMISSNWEKFIEDIVSEDFSIKHELSEDSLNLDAINVNTMSRVINYSEC